MVMPTDFFGGLTIDRKAGRWEQQLLLAVGINRTFFQQRLFPMAAYQIGFAFVNKPAWQSGLFVRPQLSCSRVNTNSTHPMVFEQQLFAGCLLSFGKRNRVQWKVAGGPTWEQNWSSNTHQYRNWFAWSYMTEIGYLYAF